VIVDSEIDNLLRAAYAPDLALIDLAAPPRHRLDCALYDGQDDCACPPHALDEGDRP